MAKSLDFLVKFVPTKYRQILSPAFEAGIKINFSPNTRRAILKFIQKPPFNFFLDFLNSPLVLIHESAGMFIYLFDNFLVWKENRLADLNMNFVTENEDNSTLCENMFRKLRNLISSLEIVEELVDGILNGTRYINDKNQVVDNSLPEPYVFKVPILQQVKRRKGALEEDRDKVSSLSPVK